MLESIKQINNPLTIIAIFAGISEISMTAALFAIGRELQVTFIWFVMGFPTLLVSLFFFTLYFKNKVLFGPSDFRNEQHFLQLMGLKLSVGEIQRKVEELSEETINIQTKDVKDIEKITEKVEQLKETTLKAKNEIELIPSLNINKGLAISVDELYLNYILFELKPHPDGLTFDELSFFSGIPDSILAEKLKKLLKEGKVEKFEDTYKIARADSFTS